MAEDARSWPCTGGRASTRLALAVTAAACVAVKFILRVHFGYFGTGFWGAAVLAVALVVLARRIPTRPELGMQVVPHAPGQRGQSSQTLSRARHNVLHGARTGSR